MAYKKADESGQAFPKNAERPAQVGMFQKGVKFINLKRN